MTKMKSVSNKRYLITPSLLNSWGYIFECVKTVKSAESDEMSLEDKMSMVQQKAYDEFIDILNKVPTKPNEYMLAGIEFEKECYEGNTCISPIIKGGCNQVVGTKEITVDGVDLLMYGRLDVLKGGVIYDIKRVQRYEVQKYKNSYQHKFYMELFPKADKFVYLAYDGVRLHTETYYADECKPTAEVISEFLGWLKENNLLKIYFEKWECKK